MLFLTVYNMSNKILIIIIGLAFHLSTHTSKSENAHQELKTTGVIAKTVAWCKEHPFLTIAGTATAAFGGYALYSKNLTIPNLVQGIQTQHANNSQRVDNINNPQSNNVSSSSSVSTRQKPDPSAKGNDSKSSDDLPQGSFISKNLIISCLTTLWTTLYATKYFPKFDTLLKKPLIAYQRKQFKVYTSELLSLKNSYVKMGIDNYKRSNNKNPDLLARRLINIQSMIQLQSKHQKNSLFTLFRKSPQSIIEAQLTARIHYKQASDFSIWQNITHKLKSLTTNPTEKWFEDLKKHRSCLYLIQKRKNDIHSHENEYLKLLKNNLFLFKENNSIDSLKKLNSSELEMTIEELFKNESNKNFKEIIEKIKSFANLIKKETEDLEKLTANSIILKKEAESSYKQLLNIPK